MVNISLYFDIRHHYYWKKSESLLKELSSNNRHKFEVSLDIFLSISLCAHYIMFEIFVKNNDKLKNIVFAKPDRPNYNFYKLIDGLNKEIQLKNFNTLKELNSIGNMIKHIKCNERANENIYDYAIKSVKDFKKYHDSVLELLSVAKDKKYIEDIWPDMQPYQSKALSN